MWIHKEKIRRFIIIVLTFLDIKLKTLTWRQIWCCHCNWLVILSHCYVKTTESWMLLKKTGLKIEQCQPCHTRYPKRTGTARLHGMTFTGNLVHNIIKLSPHYRWAGPSNIVGLLVTYAIISILFLQLLADLFTPVAR